MISDTPSGGLPPAPQRLLTVPEVAERLQVCERSVFRLIKTRRLRVVRIGRSVRIRPEDLEALLN